VEELALAGSLVIGLDDLQWADPSSLLTLGALGRRLTDLPVGVIGCLRPSPRGAELDRLADALEAAGARFLVLHPLTGEAVTGLVAQAVAAEPGPRLLAEVAGAGAIRCSSPNCSRRLPRRGRSRPWAGRRRWRRRFCRRRCG
jgi:hypothetical protein